MLTALTVAGGLWLGGKFANQQRQKRTQQQSLIKTLLNVARDADGTVSLQGTIHKLDGLYQDFVQRKLDPLLANQRDQQRQLLASTKQLPALSEDEKTANRQLGLAALNLGLAIGSTWLFPPLLLLVVPLIVYLSLRHFRRAYRALVQEHKVTIAVLDTILITGGILAGFFFAGALSIFLLTISLKFLSKTRDQSQKKLIDVFGHHPRSVWTLVGDTEVELPFEQLKAGDIVVVNAGEAIPVDGMIIKGVASIDQQALTGEAQPAEKSVNDQVLAATIVVSGRLYIRVEKAGTETVAAQIGDILNLTTGYKTTLESKAEKIVDASTLPTLALSGLAYGFIGPSGALAVLLASLGYTMRILAPLSTLNFLHITSQTGILIKDGRSLEKLVAIDTIIFDKTGTLTLEQPTVTALHPCPRFSKQQLLSYAATAEYRQTHPIARAILAAAAEQELDLFPVDDSSYEIGYGIKVKLANQVIRVGSERFMALENIAIPAEMKMLQTQCDVANTLLVMVAVDDELAGMIELQPTLRPQTKDVIANLHQLKITTAIISGDREQPTRKLAQELSIDQFFAGVLPAQKADIIKRLQAEGKTVCFIGDGINDAIALKQADVSVSLRGATTVATDTAQIVLMDGNLAHLTYLLRIAKEFENNQKANWWISVAPGIICIGGVFLLHFGIYASMALFYGSLAAGIANTMRARRLADPKLSLVHKEIDRSF